MATKKSRKRGKGRKQLRKSKKLENTKSLTTPIPGRFFKSIGLGTHIAS
jgi:hypothetical protein